MSPDPHCKENLPRLHGRYANYFEVGVNEEEVVIDFGQAYGVVDTLSIHTRIVTNRAYARDLAKLLQQSFGEFERTSGPSDSSKDSERNT